MVAAVFLLFLALLSSFRTGWMFMTQTKASSILSKTTNRQFRAFSSALFPSELLPLSIDGWRGDAQDVQRLILHEDEHVIVCYKPPTVLSQSERESPVNSHSTSSSASMQELLAEFVRTKSDKPRDGVHLVQRLDRPCSGVMLFAKSAFAMRELSLQLQRRAVRKQYLCVVNGLVERETRCEDWLRKTSGAKTHVVAGYDERRTQTRSDVVLAKMTCSPLHTWSVTRKDTLCPQTLLRVELETGRKHQIRAQLAYRQWPIVGDNKYGAPQSFAQRDIALHSHSLQFVHPQSGKPMAFSAPPPRVWSKRFATVDFDSLVLN